MEVLGTILVSFVLFAAAFVFLVFALWDLFAGDRKGAKKFGIPAVIIGILFASYAYSAARYYELDEPMAAAAWEGDKDAVVRLLNAGASPEATFDGVTALDLAGRAGHEEIIVILRKAGARR